MKKILIVRSVALTSMGYAVKDAVNEFGHDTAITILSRPENIYAMKQIHNVREVLSYPYHSFDVRKIGAELAAKLKEKNFDLVVVPINQYPRSYDNVVDFCQKILGNIPVFYYYSSLRKFVMLRRSITLEIAKKAIQLISFLGGVLLLLIYLLGMSLFFIKRRFRLNGKA